MQIFGFMTRLMNEKKLLALSFVHKLGELESILAGCS
jgi:hypothetical protein